MEQRRLRPGDRLDDYCPRERRVSDHVVVAVVDDTIKQTRCVACDAEHPFKGGQVPLRRKAKEEPALVRAAPAVEPAPDPAEDLAGTEPLPNLVLRPEKKPAKGKRAVPPADVQATNPPAPPAALPLPAVPDEGSPVAAEPASSEDEGPVHRRLIRATLPRPEGQAPVRPLPEFTIRQPGSRSAFGRGGAGQQRSPHVKSGTRSGSWQGSANGHGGPRSGMPAQDPGGPRGRSWSGRAKGANTQHKKSR